MKKTYKRQRTQNTHKLSWKPFIQPIPNGNKTPSEILRTQRVSSPNNGHEIGGRAPQEKTRITLPLAGLFWSTIPRIGQVLGKEQKLDRVIVFVQPASTRRELLFVTDARGTRKQHKLEPASLRTQTSSNEIHSTNRQYRQHPRVESYPGFD